MESDLRSSTLFAIAATERHLAIVENEHVASFGTSALSEDLRTLCTLTRWWTDNDYKGLLCSQTTETAVQMGNRGLFIRNSTRRPSLK